MTLHLVLASLVVLVLSTAIGLAAAWVFKLRGRAPAATENARLYEETKRHADRLAALYEIGRDITLILDLDALLQLIARHSARLTGADKSLILLLDTQADKIIKAVDFGLDPNQMVGITYQEVYDGLSGWVLREGTPTISQDLLADPRNTGLALQRARQESEPAQSIAVAPLSIKGKMLGTLTVINNVGKPSFDQDDLGLVVMLANQAAIAIENVRLFEETQRLKVFNEDIVQSVAEAILLEDEQGILTFANPAMEALLGYTSQELAGLHWSAIVPKHEVEKVQQELVKRPQGIESRYETVLLSKAGRVIPVIVSARPLFEDGQFSGVLSAFTDITERVRAEKEREKLIEELDAFAHTVAHDLKNPLSIASGIAEALVNDCSGLPAEEAREYLEMIARNGRKMKNIIDELLLLSTVRKMEEVGMGPLGMRDIVTEAQGRLADLIEERQAEINLSDADAWPQALGYGPWVEEVWVNYLSNAIKYGGKPPRVTVGVEQLAGQPTIRFWVRDNGPGLMPEEQQQLFTPFTRLDPVRAGGYGLGLSIVRRIVERLGGQVDVESEAGQGSVFSFTLPAA